MAKVHKVSGYDEFVSFIADLEKSTIDVLIVYFTGAKNSAGKSWCPDCNDAEPFLKKFGIDKATENHQFVIVDVGDRPTWKDTKNPFRLDRNTHLSVIPTLINWNTKEKRLEGEQICKQDLMEIFFEED